MKIVKMTTQNMTKGRNKNVPQIIVCHRTDGSYDGATTWLCNPDSKASTHFVVAKDGRVAQLVDIQDTAWGNGTKVESNDSRDYRKSTVDIVKTRGGNANEYSVSIEFECLKNEKSELTDVQFNTGVELIKYIVEEIKNIYGHEIKISPETLVGHCHVTPKWKPNCPGKEFPFGNLIDRINNENILEKRLFIINGKEIELDCVVDNGKTYAPVRPIAEQLGAEVNYNGINKVTTITDK